MLAYLYGDSQVESEVEETKAAIERIMEEAEKEEPLKPKRTPLVNALKALGLDDVDSEIEYDPEGFSLKCGEEDEHRRYVRILMEPDAMEKLAKLGWVVTRCGDVAMTNEPAEFRIRFLEITTCDSSEDGNWPAPNPDLVKKAIEKGREFATTEFDRDDENPVEDETAPNKKKAGVGDAKDGADPEGKPKTGKSKSEGAELVDQLLNPVNESRHKAGCQCGFCKNMGKGFKKKGETDDAKEDDEPKDDAPKGEPVSHGSDAPKDSGSVEHTFESEPERYESLAVRKGRPKTPVKPKTVAKAPKAAGKVGKAYKTPRK